MGKHVPNAFYYSVHGLCLRANRPLVDLAPAPSACEPALTFWSGPLDCLRKRHTALNWPEIDALDPAYPRLWRQASADNAPLLYWMGGQELQMLAIVAAAGDQIELPPSRSTLWWIPCRNACLIIDTQADQDGVLFMTTRFNNRLNAWGALDCMVRYVGKHTGM